MSTIDTLNENTNTPADEAVIDGLQPDVAVPMEETGFDVVFDGGDEKKPDSQKQDPATNAKFAAQRLERKKLRELDRKLEAVKNGQLPENLRVTPETLTPPSDADYFSDEALVKYEFDTARAQAEFQSALTEYQIKAMSAQSTVATQQAQRIQEYTAQSQADRQTIERNYDQADKLGLPDYQEKEDALAAMTSPDIVIRIATMFPEKSAALIYHLGANPATVQRLNSISERHGIIELARIEAKLTLKPRGKQVSSAPAPDEPLSGQASAANLASLKRQMDAAAEKGDTDTYLKIKNMLKGK